MGLIGKGDGSPRSALALFRSLSFPMSVKNETFQNCVVSGFELMDTDSAGMAGSIGTLMRAASDPFG